MLSRSKIVALIGAILIILTAVTPALARETITSFTANIILQTDGTVDVTETIAVNVERDEINHGIYRDIPTTLINDDKSRLRSSLHVLAVLRDGVPEPYSVENLGTGYKRIRIGDADVWLDMRPYTYTIHYTMTRMGRFFEDHDELYWNVTGNYWIFPIEKVVATVQLPPGAIVRDAVGYTGVPGSTDANVTMAQSENGNSVTFRTTVPLRAFSSVSEGLTVAVSFPKGHLVAATGITALGYWLSDHRDIVFPSFAVLLVLLYNVFAWSAVGRDPAKGTIIPRFHPPKNFSPALAHYVSSMGFKQSGWTAFTASIFDLGVKGLIEISKPGKNLEIKVTNRGPVPGLPSGESALYSYFNTEGRLTIDKEHGAKINEKKGEFVSTIERENRLTYFKNNIGYVLIGVALSALLLGVMVWLEVLQPVFIIVAIVAAIAIGILISVISGTRAGGIIGRIISFVWIAALGVNFLGGGIEFFQGLRIDTGLIAAITIIVVNLVFAVLMRAPTVQGRKVMDEIEGFKMYMDTAEKNRLNLVAEPPMTISRFEAILPFAIALGVEKPWTQHFEAELARNAVSDAQPGMVYSPAWYSGSDWSNTSTSFSNSVSSISAGMTSAMIASMPVSSSSSGFSGGGGGGSSGGGGGGGGGGGW
ncbi:MAG TPA: DUF2207 domain-containing protein [Devosia sp.]|nr:DUF2207 domain-containing protein [Devosia sp.]